MKAGAPLFCYRLSVFSDEGKMCPRFAVRYLILAIVHFPN